MAGTCIRYGDKPNVRLMEFVCDTEEEVNDLPTTTSRGKGAFNSYQQFAPMGSTCVVGNEGGGIIVYMLFDFGWKNLSEV